MCFRAKIFEERAKGVKVIVPKSYPGDLGGHANRIVSGAHRVAEKKLVKLGFSKEEIRVVLKDAWDMASLIRHAEAE